MHAPLSLEDGRDDNLRLAMLRPNSTQLDCRSVQYMHGKSTRDPLHQVGRAGSPQSCMTCSCQSRIVLLQFWVTGIFLARHRMASGSRSGPNATSLSIFPAIESIWKSSLQDIVRQCLDAHGEQSVRRQHLPPKSIRGKLPRTTCATTLYLVWVEGRVIGCAVIYSSWLWCYAPLRFVDGIRTHNQANQMVVVSIQCEQE